jgi:transcriptional regulator with XRE-family HTH domain
MLSDRGYPEVWVEGSAQSRTYGDGRVAVRILIGAQLRKLREERGITRAEAAEPIRASESKISRMELGRVGFKERDVQDLLDLYGMPAGADRATLLAKVREANEPAWWHGYHDVIPPWFQRYLGLEGAASLIRTYEVQFVPGLLQTEEYARAVIRLGHRAAGPEEIERRVRLRLNRQQVLARPDPPRFWVVVDEAALRRPVGGVRVMRDQLEALVNAVTKAPAVQLQVLPLSTGGHAAAGGAFTILRFPHRDVPDVVYIEQLTSSLYLERSEDVDQYFDAMNQLFVEAAPLAETPAILDRIIQGLPDDSR